MYVCDFIPPLFYLAAAITHNTLKEDNPYAL